MVSAWRRVSSVGVGDGGGTGMTLVVLDLVRERSRFAGLLRRFGRELNDGVVCDRPISRRLLLLAEVAAAEAAAIALVRPSRS